jgi:peptide/nickel transport system ATP-binding protein/oligopeptide transport system ATP-binding protein
VTQAPSELLSVNDVHKVFRVGAKEIHALRGISLAVSKGETLGIVGESGSGKSTLGLAILGVQPPSAGTLTFRGRTLPAGHKRPLELKREIQVVQQNPMSTLNPRRTVRQAIELPLKVHRILPAREHRARAEELLEMVGLAPEYLDRYPHSLSGGQRQRVAVARALAANPSFIVLDEPTSALDVSVQAKVVHLLVELQQQLDLTYFFITHDLSLLRNVADRIAVMYRGEIVEIGSVDDLFDAPQHPYTQMLLSAIPVVSEQEEAMKPQWDWEKVTEVGSESQGCAFAPRCPFSGPRCWREGPRLLHTDTPNHAAACFLHSPQGTS